MNLFPKTASLILLQLACSAILLSQPKCAFSHYSVDDGLSEGMILTMHQDRNGFMWFGTFDGLNRFDGYNFKVYKSGFKTHNGLTNNRIDNIIEDDLGYLWIMTYDGELHRMNTKTEEFTNFNEISYKASERYSPIQNVYCFDGGETWLVTEAGKCIRITSYQNTSAYDVKNYPYDNLAMEPDRINFIHKDREQTVWFLSDKGLSRLLPKSEVIESVIFSHSSSVESKPESFYCAHEFNDKIWFGSSGGRIREWNFGTKTFDLLKLEVKSEIIKILQLNQRELLILTSHDGFIVYNILSGEKKNYTVSKYPGLPTDDNISAYVDKFGEAWIETACDGVTHFDPFTGEIRHFRMKTEKTNPNVLLPSFFIFEDINDNLWVYPRGGGFSYYNRKEKKLEYFFNEPGDPGRKFPNLIHSAMSDSQGNLWVCTVSRGLEKITFFPGQFKILQPRPGSLNHSENEVRALFEDKNHLLWVATRDGVVYLYNQAKERIGTLRENGSFTSGPLFNGLIYCFIQDRKGNIWMGSKGSGIFKLVPSGGGLIPAYKITNYSHNSNDPYSLSHDNVYSIFEDKFGRIWVGTFNGGLNYISGEGERIKFINSFNELKKYPFTSHKKVRYITSDYNNNMLVGTTNGLVVFDQSFTDPSQITFKTYFFNPSDEYSIANNDIHYIYCSRDNEIYLGTFGGGLNKITNPGFSDSKPLFKSYTRETGAPDDIILSILDDMSGNLWLSSERGILKFHKKDGTFEIYGEQSGIESRYFSEATGIRTSNGEILMGFDNGVYYFNPEQVRKMTTIPPLAITRVQVSGVDVNSADMLSGEDEGKYTLNIYHKQKTLTIEYSTLDYRNPNNIQYARKLEGFDQEWQMEGDHRIATYNNLSPGTYIFKVKSTNSDGVWVDNEQDIPLIVHPSFWQTTIAKILYIVLFFIITFTVIYILMTFYKLRHKVEIEQLITNMKLKFFTDISHELRTPLTLISSPVGNILKNHNLQPDVRDQLTIVQSNTERMLRLVNQILDFRKVQNNKMKLRIEEFVLGSYIKDICSNFVRIAGEKGITLEINDYSDNQTIWADKDKVEKIVYNLLSNAIKFTPKGKKITVTINKKNETLELIVVDQGIGLSKEKMKNLFARFESNSDKTFSFQPGTGIGLSLSKELAGLHQAELIAESEVGHGAAFRVIFKLGCSHYENDTEFVISDNQKSTPGMPLPNAATDTETFESEEVEDNEPVLLIVEDNEELRSFLRIILADGFHVIEAGNGREGCQIAREQLPDIIISDLMMPEMNGLELAREIKADEITSHIPIVVLTAKTDLDTQVEALKTGADDFITKPFSSTYLRARIDNILMQRRRLQEIFLANLPAYHDDKKHTVEINPAAPKIDSYDDKLLAKLMQVMEENMDNSDFTVDDLVAGIGIGRSVFFKKIKSLTGLAPVEFIREVRIKRAAQLIETGQFTISQVTYMVGNNDPRYFSRIFKQRYGLTPKEYKEKHSVRKA
jgi:signal transduction histidine kinase/ligand-binding sensor domain-containing protein/DNA-binding response OmpR family regulator